jgi:hypothetical protein
MPISSLRAVFLYTTLTLALLAAYSLGRLAPTVNAIVTNVAWQNVKDFGAVGDDSADDTAAIQAAVDALGPGPFAGGGGIVYIPPGIYKVSSSINIIATGAAPHSNVTIQGDGVGSSLLRATNALVNAPVLNFDGSATNRIAFETVRDLGIDISQTASGRGIDFIIGQYITVEHIRITGPNSGPNTTEGIRLDGGPDPQLHFSGYNRITGSYIQRLNIGIHLPNQVTATAITENHITGGFQPGQHGIRMTHLNAGIAVVANEIEGWDVGIQSGGSGLMAVANRFESNTTAHIRFAQDPPGGTTLYSTTMANTNWGPSPMVLTPHTPNAYYDAITTFDVNSEFSVPMKQIAAYAYTANGREGLSTIKSIPTALGTCTMVFTGGILTGGTC